MSTPEPSPVVVDGRVSDEKLGELLNLQTEYPELDFKRMMDLAAKSDEVELAKDVGAMQVLGGYIVVGVDGRGKPTGDLDPRHRTRFDEANLTPKLLKYLPDPITIRTSWYEIEGQAVAIIFVGPSPEGCAVFKSDGKYERNGAEVVVFREGDIFWRDGTRSVRISQHGLREVMRQAVGNQRAAWMAEQQDIRRQEFDQLQLAYQSRQVADAPVGALTLDLDVATLTSAALELARTNDGIPLRRLLNEALARERSIYGNEDADLEEELGEVLDKLACLAATFLEYELTEWFDHTMDAIASHYDLGLDQMGRHLGYATAISPEERQPRLWLLVVSRVYAIGALGVRRRRWDAIRRIALTRPDRLESYYTAWLRHGLIMASRARHLGDETNKLSVLSLAAQHVARLACLRPDGVEPDDEEILTSLAQFDLLIALVVIADSRSLDTVGYYTNFARFHSERVVPIVVRLLHDERLRGAVFPLSDADLVLALSRLNEMASHEGFFSGFHGFREREIVEFMEAEHLTDDVALAAPRD